MKTKFFSALKFLGVISCLSGCSAEIPLTRLPPNLVLEAYKSGGQLISKETIGVDSQTYSRLSNLLIDEKFGWQPVFAAYVPGPYVFRGDGLTISCYQTLIVIDFLLNGEHISKQKRIPKLLMKLGLDSEVNLKRR